MWRVATAVSFVGLFVLSGCVDAGAQPEAPAASDPYLLVVHGDSFTAALDPGRGDRNELSWATGTEPGLDSVLERLRGQGRDASASNVAFSGARMLDVPGQALRAPRGADLVLLFLGTNDLCWPTPTTPEAFRSGTDAALDLLRTNHPDARIVVFAVPDLWRLHELHLAEPQALAFWAGNRDYCPDFFNPSPSPSAPAIARTRLDSFNGILQDEAEAHGAAYSGATFWPGWSLEHFSDRDYFHPNLGGEARLAAAAWPAIGA